MNKNKTPFYVILALLIIIFGIFATVVISPSNDEADNYLEQYTKIHNNFNSFQVEKIVKNGASKPQQPGGDQPPGGLNTPLTWINCCIAAHHSMGHAGATFNPVDTISIDGQKLGCDGFGYLGYALCLYKATSTALEMTVDQMSTASNFKQITLSSEQELQQGDILFFNNTVEVFYALNGTNLVTLSWSSPKVSSDLYSSDDKSGHDALDCAVNTATQSPMHFSDITTIYREYGKTQQSGDDVLLAMPIYVKQGGSPQGSWKVAGSSKTCSSIGCAYCSYFMVCCYFNGSAFPIEGGKPSFQHGLGGGNGIYTQGNVNLNNSNLFAYFGSSVRYSGERHGVNVDTIKAEIDKGNPVVYCAANITDASGKAVKKVVGVVPSRSTHFVVIMGYSDTKQCFYLYDPAKEPAPREFTYADYLESQQICNKCNIRTKQ